MSRSERACEEQLDQSVTLVKNLGARSFRRVAKNLDQSSIFLSLPNITEMKKWQEKGVAPEAMLSLEWGVVHEGRNTKGYCLRLKHVSGSDFLTITGPDAERTIYNIPLQIDGCRLDEDSVAQNIDGCVKEILTSPILFDKTEWELPTDRYFDGQERHAKRYTNVLI